MVERGERLEKPKHCPDKIYSVMKKCWKKEPDHRPTFQFLENFFATADIVLTPAAIVAEPEKTREQSTELSLDLNLDLNLNLNLVDSSDSNEANLSDSFGDFPELGPTAPAPKLPSVPPPPRVPRRGAINNLSKADSLELIDFNEEPF